MRRSCGWINAVKAAKLHYAVRGIGPRNGTKNQLCCRPGIGLNVDAPLGRIKVKRMQGTLSAENFEFVDPFVSSVVASIRKAFGVLVRQDRTISLHGGETGEVLEPTWSEASIGIKRSSTTSDAMSSSPVNCLHVSLSMMFWTSGSASAKGWYRTLF